MINDGILVRTITMIRVLVKCWVLTRPPFRSFSPIDSHPELRPGTPLCAETTAMTSNC